MDERRSAPSSTAEPAVQRDRSGLAERNLAEAQSALDGLTDVIIQICNAGVPMQAVPGIQVVLGYVAARTRLAQAWAGQTDPAGVEEPGDVIAVPVPAGHPVTERRSNGGLVLPS